MREAASSFDHITRIHLQTLSPGMYQVRGGGSVPARVFVRARAYAYIGTAVVGGCTILYYYIRYNGRTGSSVFGFYTVHGTRTTAYKPPPPTAETVKKMVLQRTGREGNAGTGHITRVLPYALAVRI